MLGRSALFGRGAALRHGVRSVSGAGGGSGAASSRSGAGKSLRGAVEATLDKARERFMTRFGMKGLLYLYHAGNIIVVMSLTSTDMLSLRSFALAGNLTFLFFSAVSPTRNLGTLIWPVGFSALNAYHIVKILRERANIEFEPKVEELYQLAFKPAGFSRTCFQEIVTSSGASWETYKKGEVIINQGAEVQSVGFLLKGTLEVKRNNKLVNVYLGKGSADSARELKLDSNGNKIVDFFHGGGQGVWISSNLTDPKAEGLEYWPYSVVAQEDGTQIVKFRKRGLREEIMKDIGRKHSCDRMMLLDLWNKLAFKQELLNASRKAAKKEKQTLEKVIAESNLKTYEEIVKLALADGELSPLEVEQIDRYRYVNGISNEDHVAIFQKYDICAKCERPNLVCACSLAIDAVQSRPDKHD